MFTKQVTLPVSKDEFNLTLDVVVEQGFAYLLQTRTDPYTYDGSSVKKVDLSTMGYEVIFKAEVKDVRLANDNEVTNIKNQSNGSNRH